MRRGLLGRASEPPLLVDVGEGRTQDQRCVCVCVWPPEGTVFTILRSIEIKSVLRPTPPHTAIDYPGPHPRGDVWAAPHLPQGVPDGRPLWSRPRTPTVRGPIESG